MILTCDPVKRQRTVESRGLDFEDATHVVAGTTVELEDIRRDSGNVGSSVTDDWRDGWS